MVALVHCCPAVPMGANDHHHNHVHLAQKIRFVRIKQNTCGQQQEKKGKKRQHRDDRHHYHTHHWIRW